MKILVVHNRYRSTAPSGEDAVVDQESAMLSARGHDVRHFERHSDDISGWPVARKALLPATVLWSEEARRHLARVLREDRPDVVHVHNTFPLISPSILRACTAAGVPVVHTVHNYKLACASGEFFRDGRPCHECADGSVLPALRHGCYRGKRTATVPIALRTLLHRSAWREQVAAYIFISQAQRELLAPLGLPPERCHVKPNFVQPPPEVPADSRHEVVYLGRQDSAKGVDLLMQAWDAFRDRHRDSRLSLALVGGGPLAEDVAAWAGDRPDVRVTGVLPRDEARRRLAGARAAVIPSRWEETFGLVAVEAMAVGVPSIAAAHGSFPELITDGVDGRLFAPGSSESLAAAFAEVDRDPDAFRRRGENAHQTYLRRFQPDANIDQLIEIYRGVIDRAAGITGAQGPLKILNGS